MDAEHNATADPAATIDDRGSNDVTSANGARTTTQNGQLLLHVGDRTDVVDWRLDEQTRAVGRRGIAQARAALRSARADHLERADNQQRHGAASSRRPTAA
jgi:hypothetical protein